MLTSFIQLSFWKSNLSKSLLLIFLSIGGLTACASSTGSPTGSSATSASTTGDGGLTSTPFDIPVTIGKLQINTIDSRQTEGGGSGFGSSDSGALVKAMLAGVTSVSGAFIHGEIGAADASANIVIADTNDTSITTTVTAESDGSFLADLSSLDLADGEVHTFSLQEGDLLEASTPIYVSFKIDDSILDSALRFAPFNVTVTNNTSENSEEDNLTINNATGNVTFNLTVDGEVKTAFLPIKGGTAALIPHVSDIHHQVYASDGSFFLFKDPNNLIHQYVIATETDNTIDDKAMQFRFFSLCHDDRTVVQEDVPVSNTLEMSLVKVDLQNLDGTNDVFLKKTGAKPVDVGCFYDSSATVAFIQQGSVYIAYLFNLENTSARGTLLFRTPAVINHISLLPDDSGFVYEKNDVAGVKQLHFYTFADGSDVALTSDATNNSVHPSISFEGDFLLFQRKVDDVFQIFTYEFATGKTFQLTSDVQAVAPTASETENIVTYKYGDTFQVGVINLDNLF